MDRPAFPDTYAVPIATRMMVREKTSGLRALTTASISRGKARRAVTAIPASKTRDHPRPPRTRSQLVSSAPSIGTRSSIGTTAMSWRIRTLTQKRP